jgi:hypothetical protein
MTYVAIKGITRLNHGIPLSRTSAAVHSPKITSWATRWTLTRNASGARREALGWAMPGEGEAAINGRWVGGQDIDMRVARLVRTNTRPCWGGNNIAPARLLTKDRLSSVMKNAYGGMMRKRRLKRTMEQGALQARYASQLLHFDEQVSLKNKLALLVLLVVFVGIFIFPTQYSVALDALNIPYNMVAGGHLAFNRFTFKDVDYIAKQVCATMLSVK